MALERKNQMLGVESREAQIFNVSSYLNISNCLIEERAKTSLALIHGHVLVPLIMYPFRYLKHNL